MQHAKLLDCTLRDGAYLVNKKFGDHVIRGIIEGLVKARVDCIEIGFFQDEEFGEGKTVFKNSADAMRFVPADKNGAMFTVLADCSRYSVENLDECSGVSVDAVRECFFKAERFEAVQKCRKIMKKGYKCFVQPVDILGYTDVELIELVGLINEIEPYCFSIVDTFGSMYQEDLRRVFELLHHNLASPCRIGFHSHNNMQMSNALSQEFVRMTYGKREIVVDGTISGMGRGAGNTPTELIAQYMVSQLGYNYDMDALLDLIDDYMDGIRSRCTWGYSTPYFVAGCYSAHVNNVAYLTKKNSIRSRDIRYILNKVGEQPRKRYDYDMLEQTYLDYLASDVDDTETLQKLGKVFSGENILLLLPGSTAVLQTDKIKAYIREKKPVIIGINFVHETVPQDFIYISNTRRYQYWRNSPVFQKQKKIIASNLKTEAACDDEYIISFNKLVKCGWEHMDNSGIMVMRLLDMFDIQELALAGFDGYGYSDTDNKNYASEELEISAVSNEPKRLNEEIMSMLTDFMETRKKEYKILFVTDSRFSEVVKLRNR